ncbi:MAG TPA: hypothetical protein VIP11_16420 [Gemmatimonadaceae bacterium]
MKAGLIIPLLATLFAAPHRPATDTYKSVEVTLAQTQPGRPYRLPLEIGVTAPGANGAAATRIEKIDLRQSQQRFTIPVTAAPATVTLDPNTWVLMRSTFSAK